MNDECSELFVGRVLGRVKKLLRSAVSRREPDEATPKRPRSLTGMKRGKAWTTGKSKMYYVSE